MRRKTFLILLVIGLLLATPSRPGNASSLSAMAGTQYALPGGIVIDSSPTLADVDGDGLKEILVGTTGRDPVSGIHDRPTVLVILSGDGELLASQDVGAPITSAPAVGDIDNDGQKEIVVGLGGDPDREEKLHHGGVAAYEYGTSLERIWRFRTSDWNQDGYDDGVRSSPALCDVDGDGDLEIAFGSWDRRIYLIDDGGESLWEDPYGYGSGYYNADTVWSSAACADLNYDGHQEIIIGADIHGGGILPDGTQPEDGGYLYIFDKDGNVLVRRHVPESIYSSPAVGDLDEDGSLEIVVGTSYYYWQRKTPPPVPLVYVFDTSRVFSARHYGDDGKLPYADGWPRSTAYPGYSSPALADLDDDGNLEVIIGSGLPSGASTECSGSASDPECYGSVYAWHHNGDPVSGFPMWPKDRMDKNSFVRSSPVVADMDADGQLEILFSMLWSVIVVGPAGLQEGALRTTYSLHASPAVGDADGNGRLEVWIGGSEYDNQSQGYLWRFEAETSGVGSLPWPMFHRDARNTGRYPVPPRLVVNPESIYLMHQQGSGGEVQRQVEIQNAGDGTLDWYVASTPNNVSVTPSGGTSSSSSTVDVTIDAATFDTGTHDVGEGIEITATSDGEPVDGSPVQIPITLYVGDVHTVHLPLSMRSAP